MRIHLFSSRYGGHSKNFITCAKTVLRSNQRFSRSFSTNSICAATQEGNRVLFVSPVWPERSSSAAGVRTCDLIESFQRRDYTVAYTSPSTPNEHTNLIKSSGVQVFECLPNRESDFEKVLTAVKPSIVIFDRYYAEEMFSFRVKELFPNALRVLDMQDCHFLREGRQKLAKTGATLQSILSTRPDTTSSSCLRELASIHRSDLTLVCSPVELSMLSTHYYIPSQKLTLAPFFAPPSPNASAPVPFAERQHFIMIGNFRHPPNFDSVKWACREIWPIIRKELKLKTSGGPKPELHLYGSYAPQAAAELHKPSDGIVFKGFAPSLDIMQHYRVLLAPLKFGAGLKGKVVDAWWHGLPVCTTPIGSEGMTGSNDGPWGGLDQGTDSTSIARDAVRLYDNTENVWEESQTRGFELLRELYDAEKNLNGIHAAIEKTKKNVEERRLNDFVGEMLWQQQMRATEYFSKWIELKETSKLIEPK